MKLKTSFSDLTTFKKDITRFAPIWGLYLIGLLLTLISDGSRYSYDRFAYNYLPELISSFGVVNLIYASVCAVMLFGDLYNTRMCYSLHTIPQKREHLFLSHTAAALCFSLVPNLVASLYLMVPLQQYWFLALYWLLAVTAQFLFFFGIAALSAMLTGNRFAMLLVCAGINFVAILAYWILDTIYFPQMEGVVLNYDPFALLTPVVKLFDFEYLAFISVESSQIPGDWVPEIYPSDYYTTYFYQYTGLADGWGYTAILAAIGAAASGIALLLYKLRHLEVAGDFLAFPKLKNAACVIMTICVAGVAALLGDAMSNSMELWLLVGIAVGFFGSLMLLERRIRVFRKKTFLGFVLLAAVLIASFLAVVFDVFGVVHWVPKASEVESVILSNYLSNNNLYNYDGNYYGTRLAVKLTEDDDIDSILIAHQQILDQLDDADPLESRYQSVVLTYTLEDGRRIIREYSIPTQGEAYQTVQRILYSPQQVLGYTDWDTYCKQVEAIVIDGMEVPAFLREKFLHALRSDCEKGHIVTYDRAYDYEKENQTIYDLNIEIRSPNNSYTHRNLAILPKAEETIALISSPEFLLGYENWDTYPDSVTYIEFSGTELPRHVYPQFLDAMRRDAQAGALTLNDPTAPYDAVIYIQHGNTRFDRYLYITKNAVRTLSWYHEYKESGK